MWNWQQSNWPNWRFDPSSLQELEAKFLLGSGRLQGIRKHVSVEDRKQVRIDLLSDEAMKTSAIEGEFLDRSSVQSSIMRQFGLASDRREAEAGRRDAFKRWYVMYGMIYKIPETKPNTL